MRRVILVILGLFCTVGLCMAQNSPARIRRVTAIQELRASGMSAAYNDIPITSKAKVTNPANGMEIEVTIVEHIPGPDQPVIDLSPAAARALGIVSVGPVLVLPLAQAQPAAPLFDDDDDDLPAVVTKVTEPEPEKPPYQITINNYIINPDPPPASAPTVPEVSGHENLPEKETAAPLPPIPSQPQAPSPLFTSPPFSSIQIIPGLPDPHSGKLYRLMVGAYPGIDSAYHVFRQLEAAGFKVAQEQVGDLCMVYAAGIPSTMVYYAAMRLGAIGFQQVWVYE